MKKAGLIYLFLVTMVVAWGQNERKVIRQGLRAYKAGEFSEAEVQFRKAGDINQESFEAGFNTGTALYGQEKYEETVKQYESLAKQSQGAVEDDPESLAHIWHNMGNSLLEAQQYGPSIEAFKNSLRLNPDDYDTKYNLAYAKQKLKEQENQDQEGENDQEQGEKDEQEQNQEDQKKSQGEQNQDDRFKNEEEQKQDQEQQEQEDQQQQPQSREISKEDAERMLNAIQQQEKDVKDKVDKEKAAAAKVKTKKDW